MKRFISTSGKFALLYFFLILAVVALFTSIVEAKKKGITGLTSTQSSGCDCHSTNANSSVSITLQSQSGSFTFPPGSTNTFSINVSHPSIKVSGINIAVKTTMNGNTDAGTLVPIGGEGLQLKQGELTHTQPKVCTSSNANYSFQWTAPTTPGQYYLRVIALAGNGNGKKDANDLWNWLPPQLITVEQTTDINEESDILVPPNQFNPILYARLVAPETIAKVKLLNINGAVIKEFDHDNGEILVNFYQEPLPTGIYFLVIESLSRSRTHKFVYTR